MTTASKMPAKASLGDRFAELAVVVLTLLALIGGWLFKSSVENRSLAFQNGEVSAQTPASWLMLTPSGNEILHVTDRTTSGFGTTYLIEREAIPADAGFGQVFSLLTLERGSRLTAYRVLNQQQVLVGDLQALEVEYVYVESADNLTHDIMPAVVHALDYIFLQEEQALIISYRADQSAYEADLNRFQRFLISISY